MGVVSSLCDPFLERFLVIAYQDVGTKAWKVMSITNNTDTAAEVENKQGFDKPDKYSMARSNAVA